MVFSYALVALLAIAGYEVFRSSATDDRMGIAEVIVRTLVVIITLSLALPLGAFLGAAVVSAATESVIAGVITFTASVALVAFLGIGCYVAAEGEIPSYIRNIITAPTYRP